MGLVELLVRIGSGIGLLVANGIFVTTEFALTRLRQFNKDELGEGWGIELAWEMTEQLEIYLTACQVGITVTSILLGVVFEPGVTALIYPVTELIGMGATNTEFVSIAVAVVLIQFMHTVWGEQSPTYLGVEKPREVAAVFVPIIYGWTWMSYPLIWIGDHLAKWTLGLFGVTLSRSWTEEGPEIEDRSDLRRQIGELLSKGELSDERRTEVINALEIAEMTTREIMVDRADVKYIDTTRPVPENLDVLSENYFSRFPVVEGSLDNYRGALYVPVALSNIDGLREGTIEWKDLAVDAMTVPSTLSVSELVDRFQAENQELALVLEDATVIGLVTSTDALEAIIGELRDPYD